MNNEKENKIIAIHQPNYLPWLGYFYKIHQSDLFVFLDDAQFSNEGMHNYTYIKTSQGSFRLKIPVHQKLGDKIFEVRSKDELDWKKKHIKTLEANYRRAKFFPEVFIDYVTLIEKEYANIASINNTMIRFFADKLGIKTAFINSSELNINSGREEKILDLLNILGGTVYYSGTGARTYQKDENFKARGIELRYSVFTPFEYPQLWDGFQSNITALDFFMNCGYDWDRVIKSQQQV